MKLWKIAFGSSACSPVMNSLRHLIAGKAHELFAQPLLMKSESNKK